MPLESYPSFRPLEREDKVLFDAAFKLKPPKISEFTFTNLYSWRNAYQFEASLLDSFIIVRVAANKLPRFFDPIGSPDKQGVIEKILFDTRGEFVRIPESTKALFDRDTRFRIEEDARNADYVYEMDDLVSLPGKKYDGKRNLIKKFKSTHSYDYRTFDASTIKECLAFEDSWCTIKDCDSVEGLRNEREAIRSMIENFAAFGLNAAGIRIASGICAIAIAEALNPDTLVMHVLKADAQIIGLYQTMLNEFLMRESGKFRYVNLEQDLGIEGLRRSKRSYQPIEMVKKYNLSLP